MCSSIYVQRPAWRPRACARAAQRGRRGRAGARLPGGARLLRACQPECAPGGPDTPWAAPGHACMRGSYRCLNTLLPPRLVVMPLNQQRDIVQVRGAPGAAGGAVRRVPGPGAAQRRVRGYARRRLPGERAAPGAAAAHRYRAVRSGARAPGLVARPHPEQCIPLTYPVSTYMMELRVNLARRPCLTVSHGPPHGRDVQGAALCCTCATLNPWSSPFPSKMCCPYARAAPPATCARH